MRADASVLFVSGPVGQLRPEVPVLEAFATGAAILGHHKACTCLKFALFLIATYSRTGVGND